MARVHPPRSTTEDAFWTPLAILPLRGGGGSGIGHATLERLRLIHRDQRFPGGFWTPLAILPLMGGGVRNNVACKVGPLPVMTTTVSRFPLATCMPPNRAMGVSHWLFSTPVKVYSYWPFVDPMGIHPYGMHVSPGGLRWLQSLMFGHYCSAGARNTNRHYVQTEP
jgi:hypothetical protein